MDWNWFFSSVAQSTAAIVGILAAFIITKIINNQTLFKKNVLEIKRLVKDSNKLSHQFSKINISYYNDNYKEDGLKNLEDIIKQVETKDPKLIYHLLDLSEFEDFKGVIEKIRNIIKREEKDSDSEVVTQMINALRSTLSPLGYMAAINPTRKLEHPEKDLIIYKHISSIRSTINDLISNIEYQIIDNKEHLKVLEDNLEKSTLVNKILLLTLLLFFIGVIYPLTFLPVAGNLELSFSIYNFLNILLSISGIILLVISLIFSTIIIIFRNLNNSLIYNKDQILLLKEYTKIQNYSKHLRNYVFNTHLKKHYNNKIFVDNKNLE